MRCSTDDVNRCYHHDWGVADRDAESIETGDSAAKVAEVAVRTNGL